MSGAWTTGVVALLAVVAGVVAPAVVWSLTVAAVRAHGRRRGRRDLLLRAARFETRARDARDAERAAWRALAAGLRREAEGRWER